MCVIRWLVNEIFFIVKSLDVEVLLSINYYVLFFIYRVNLSK